MYNKHLTVEKVDIQIQQHIPHINSPSFIYTMSMPISQELTKRLHKVNTIFIAHI